MFCKKNLLQKRKFIKNTKNIYFLYYLNPFFKVFFIIKINFDKYLYWKYLKKNVI